MALDGDFRAGGGTVHLAHPLAGSMASWQENALSPIRLSPLEASLKTLRVRFSIDKGALLG
jgi:hypothetical protein